MLHCEPKELQTVRERKNEMEQYHQIVSPLGHHRYSGMVLELVTTAVQENR